MNTQRIKDSTLGHIWPSIAFTIVTVLIFGLLYPAVMTGLSELLFPSQANGSIVYRNGAPIGSDIIGQLWTKPQYFHGRPSAAGNGYDPTSTGATNLGPTSKKLIDATRAAIVALKKENP
ncbi:MAG TPA: potassium-transporting ATPase subunit C, partial [Candidatus Eremiobacteraceae bacterium]|nr:potassium-transporting ATPase subunit C [Candidatus Eremiobacteraceae bacterium]